MEIGGKKMSISIVYWLLLVESGLEVLLGHLLHGHRHHVHRILHLQLFLKGYKKNNCSNIVMPSSFIINT